MTAAAAAVRWFGFAEQNKLTAKMNGYTLACVQALLFVYLCARVCACVGLKLCERLRLPRLRVQRMAVVPVHHWS